MSRGMRVAPRRTGAGRAVRDALLALMLLSAGVGGAPGASAAANVLVGPNATVPPAHCGPESSPEDGVQGEVPVKDRQDGRSQLGYRCNLVELGGYQGVGAGWQNAWYGNCDYYDTGQNAVAPGVQVVQITNPQHPTATTRLTTPAMLGPWESLKVNQRRGLLGAVAAYDAAGQGPLFFDVYDVKADCAHPKLLASVPFNVPVGHEGNWAPDGMTYYGSSTLEGTVAAINVSNPASPTLISVIHNGTHGLSVSADGTRLYMANTGGNGLDILDASSIQNRSAPPITTLPSIGHVYWTDGSTAQSTIPITYGHRPYILFFDEGGGSCCGTGSGTLGAVQGVPAGAARIIDIADPSHPKIVSVLRLAIQSPKYAAQNQAEVKGNGLFGYEAHYCAVDRPVNPTAAACGYFQSGIRVFDIRNPLRPREIAYFNPPAQVSKHGQLPGSEHDGGFSNPGGTDYGQPPNLTADWCTSQIRFYTAKDGSHELWAQCQDNGFMVLKFTNGAYPLPAGSAEVGSALKTPAVSGAGSLITRADPTTSANGALAATGGTPVLPGLALLAVVGGLFAAQRRSISPLRPSRCPRFS